MSKFKDVEKDFPSDLYIEHPLHKEYEPRCSTCYSQSFKKCLQTGCLTHTQYAFCEEHEDPLGGDGIDD